MKAREQFPHGLNNIRFIEEVAPELGMRVFVCLASENEGYRDIPGITHLRTLGTEHEWMNEWWIDMWDRAPGDFSLGSGIGHMIASWEDLGASDETILLWYNTWESRPLYDWAYEEALNRDLWEEGVANGEHWAMSD